MLVLCVPAWIRTSNLCIIIPVLYPLRQPVTDAHHCDEKNQNTRYTWLSDKGQVWPLMESSMEGQIWPSYESQGYEGSWFVCL